MSDIAYIYHVIGTLDLQHIKYGMESMKNQDFHWKTFILYNGSDIPTEDILPLVDKSKFDKVEVYPYPPNIPKSTVADWQEQMNGISGYDKYFVHKADFYLADGVCKAFEELKEAEPWIAIFHKFDMKEKATIKTIEKYASSEWEDCMTYPETGEYWGEHIGKLAIPFKQKPNELDNTIHGYTDGVREFYKPSEREVERPWGKTIALQELVYDTGLILDDRLFALHMYHEVPQKNDPRKIIEGERF